ncbi:hypothetical protein L1887_10020 [Cichorium endivia]|nr:hypothetical protein L1887_10020 [Cichorium endivia]
MRKLGKRSFSVSQITQNKIKNELIFSLYENKKKKLEHNTRASRNPSSKFTDTLFVLGFQSQIDPHRFVWQP